MAHIIPYRITFNDPYNGCAVFAWLYEPQSILLKGVSLRDYIGEQLWGLLKGVLGV